MYLTKTLRRLDLLKCDVSTLVCFRSLRGQPLESILKRLYVDLNSFFILLETWVSGLNHRPAKTAVRKGSRVRIPPFPPYWRSGLMKIGCIYVDNMLLL